MSLVGFNIRPSEAAIENIIGGKVDQAGVVLAAGDSKIAHCQRICVVSSARLLLSDIHLIVGGGIENHLRFDAGQSALNLSRAGHVNLHSLVARDFISTAAQ